MKRYKIGDVCSRLSSGKSIRATKIQDDGDYPVIGGNGLRGYTETFNFDGECAVIGRQGAACGNVRFHSGKAYMTEHAIVAVANECNDSHYLAYRLSMMHLGRLSAQSAQPGLSVKTLSWQEVDLPSLKEQEQVVAVLGTLDAKIEANAKLNGYLEELARAVYVSAMQEHADIASLCDLAEFNPETYSPKENWSAVSYIDTSALMLNDLAGLQHFNPAEEKLPTRARRKVSNGDILYSTVRPNQNHYGLLYSPEPHTLASTAFAVIRPNDTIMSPLVYLALTDARITKTLQQLAETSTSTIPSIRPVDLERIAVLVPSDEYGSEIADQIGTTFKQIDCNKRENRKLAAFRDALLPKLMSGEIDVSKIDLTQLNSHLA